MKKQNKILFVGIFSILVLVSVQAFIITGIWRQKSEMFSLQYTMRSQEGLYFINRALFTDGFDTARMFLALYSEIVANEFKLMTDDAEIDLKKKEVLEYFTIVLNEEQELSRLLSTYFELRGYEKNLVFSIVLNELDIIDNDTIPIFHQNPTREMQETSKSLIFINWFGMEDNHYRLRFEYFIDFSNKQKIILKESAITLTMSIFSIVVVVIIFIIAYRNLMEEKRLSNLKTDFINNMTHELKTPLSTITVAGKTLEMPVIISSAEKIRETAALIRKQSVHLNRLINMILEISVGERAQFELDKKNLEIEPLLNDIIDCFKTGAGNKIVINKKFRLEGVFAELDTVHFTALLNNLLSNAEKYTDKEPVIEVEGFINDSNLIIKVSDNGIGISKNDQRHIFDKFYRASTGNIHKFKGLGLGLYYVKKITEAHGGTVKVNSKTGKGSVITVIIPQKTTQ